MGFGLSESEAFKRAIVGGRIEAGTAGNVIWYSDNLIGHCTLPGVFFCCSVFYGKFLTVSLAVAVSMTGGAYGVAWPIAEGSIL